MSFQAPATKGFHSFVSSDAHARRKWANVWKLDDDGQVLWSQRIGDEDAINNGTFVDCVAGDGTDVYVAGLSSGVIAGATYTSRVWKLDGNTGAVIWTYDIGEYWSGGAYQNYAYIRGFNFDGGYLWVASGQSNRWEGTSTAQGTTKGLWKIAPAGTLSASACPGTDHMSSVSGAQVWTGHTGGWERFNTSFVSQSGPLGAGSVAGMWGNSTHLYEPAAAGQVSRRITTLGLDATWSVTWSGSGMGVGTITGDGTSSIFCAASTASSANHTRRVAIATGNEAWRFDHGSPATNWCRRPSMYGAYLYAGGGTSNDFTGNSGEYKSLHQLDKSAGTRNWSWASSDIYDHRLTGIHSEDGCVYVSGNRSCTWESAGG